VKINAKLPLISGRQKKGKKNHENVYHSIKVVKKRKSYPCDRPWRPTGF
jgi:hypothetical protein